MARYHRNMEEKKKNISLTFCLVNFIASCVKFFSTYRFIVKCTDNITDNELTILY